MANARQLAGFNLTQVGARFESQRARPDDNPRGFDTARQTAGDDTIERYFGQQSSCCLRLVPAHLIEWDRLRTERTAVRIKVIDRAVAHQVDASARNARFFC